jgi:hypothetical protein
MSYEEASNQAVQELEGRQEDSPDEGGAAPIEGQGDDQGGQQVQDGGQQGGGQPTWNPKEYALKYRDKEVLPRDRQHLIDLAQQGFSYSKRMAELKELEKQLETQRGKYSQYSQLEEAFAKNPVFRKKVLEWYNSSMSPDGGQQEEGGQAAAIPKELVDTIRELQERVGKYDEDRQLHEQERADKELSGEIDELKKKYSRQDWDQLASSGKTLMQEICEHAYNMGGIKLETAYRDLMWDSHTKNSEANGRKAAAESAAAAKKAGMVSGGKSKGAATPQEVNTSGMSYDQLARHITKEFNLSS